MGKEGLILKWMLDNEGMEVWAGKKLIRISFAICTMLFTKHYSVSSSTLKSGGLFLFTP
jgi:hypothetical protein